MNLKLKLALLLSLLLVACLPKKAIVAPAPVKEPDEFVPRPVPPPRVIKVAHMVPGRDPFQAPDRRVTPELTALWAKEVDSIVDLLCRRGNNADARDRACLKQFLDHGTTLLEDAESPLAESIERDLLGGLILLRYCVVQYQWMDLAAQADALMKALPFRGLLFVPLRGKSTLVTESNRNTLHQTLQPCG